MKISGLKIGDQFYYIENGRVVRWYRYVCVHPCNKNYHILLKENMDPVRLYKKELQLLLNKSFLNYQEARESILPFCVDTLIGEIELRVGSESLVAANVAKKILNRFKPSNEIPF